MNDSIHLEAHRRYVTDSSPDGAKASSVAALQTPAHPMYKFVDYRAAASPDSHKKVPPMVTRIIESLTKPKRIPEDGTSLNRSLPLVLLYDNKGLELFDRITYLPEYYLTDCEIEVLKSNIREIVAEIPDGSDVIELGCGALRKTQLLLEELDRVRSDIAYYAIDVMPLPLHKSLAELAQRFKNISFVALCGTYDEVLHHFKKAARPKTLLWLGSSVGNYSAADAYEFLGNIVERALVPNDAIIVGFDRKKDSDVVMDAYHDSENITAEFELNALRHANSIVADAVAVLRGNATLSDPSLDGLFDVSKFAYTGDYNQVLGRHSAYLRAREDIVIKWPAELLAIVKGICGSDQNLVIKRGELIFIEYSYKFGPAAPEMLARGCGLLHCAEWSDSRSYYTLNLFRKPPATISPLPAATIAAESIEQSDVSAFGHVQKLQALLQNIKTLRQPSSIPQISEWKHLWSVWDLLTLEIISRDQMLEKPIDLRHPFIFYLGHLPAFTDIHLSRAESAPLTEPAIYAEWFERGIDPNILDPSKCHSHSTPPSEWPEINDILAYRDRVRARIVDWLTVHEKQSERNTSADAARHVWMSFEHEAMHIETMLYMVLQMDPACIRSPIDMRFAPKANDCTPNVDWISFNGGLDIKIGLANDCEAALRDASLPQRHVFGWDNEGPQTSVDIQPFSVRIQPITNGEYLEFVIDQRRNSNDSSAVAEKTVPKSWIKLASGEYGVRTVVGNPSVSTSEASLWPVFVSQTQASAYASWCGKRLPTEAEWTHASRTYHLAWSLSQISESTAHTYNQKSREPVDKYLERLLAAYEIDASEFEWPPYDMFVPENANIDFAHWHPLPEATNKSVGRYTTNGLQTGLPEARFVGNGWEWTCTQFHPFDGFAASSMYPGYSADFFDFSNSGDQDSTHYVVKGASYATHRRIAQRQTFRNWYQRGYPYVLATFRLCK
ncbi:hypothetical protein LPJ64_005974 [Coemansia asiatica]|uniref:Uncharacterized protein n=1 Tax=Coemansia asiatica TaxID=1052880 RepID=A0A9W8CH51_9FUNG|nr:hypothetical protein LPJ64_005974 [Coemansia asiatica]